MKFKEVVDRTLMLEPSDDAYPVIGVEANSCGPACMTFSNAVLNTAPVQGATDADFRPGVVTVQVRSAEEAYRIAKAAGQLAEWMEAREHERKGR